MASDLVLETAGSLSLGGSNRLSLVRPSSRSTNTSYSGPRRCCLRIVVCLLDFNNRGVDLTRSTVPVCPGHLASCRPVPSEGQPCLLAWQTLHRFTLHRTSRPILGQYHRSCSLSITCWTPAWVCWWVISINSWDMASGQTTLLFSGCLSPADSVMVNSPSSLIHSESQLWQSSRNSAHPCPSCTSLGRCLFLFAWYTSATTPWRFAWASRSSVTLSAKTGLAQRVCTASGSLLTTGVGWLWPPSGLAKP